MSNVTPTGFASNFKDNVAGVAFNDMYIDANGNIVTNGGVESVINAVYTGLWLFIGEYDFDNTLGIAYKGIANADGVFESQIEQNILAINNYLTPTDLATYGIDTINSVKFDLNRQTRVINIAVNITLNNGEKLALSTGTSS